MVGFDDNLVKAQDIALLKAGSSYYQRICSHIRSHRYEKYPIHRFLLISLSKHCQVNLLILSGRFSLPNIVMNN